MQTIALTGGIACGKSRVAKLLAQKGLFVVNIDEMVHDALKPVGSAYQEVVKKFGSAILMKDGQIDRKELGALVFSNESARKELEGIVHPAVFDMMQSAIEQSRERGLSYLIIEIPLLFEVGWERFFDKIWVVSSSPEVQLTRLQNRDHLTEERARQRIAAQLPLSYKEEKADAIIYNNLGLPELTIQVEQMIKNLE